MPQYSKTPLPVCLPHSFDTTYPMALFASEPQHVLSSTEDYNSLYELVSFPFSSSESLDIFLPEPVLGLDQNGFLSMVNYQSDFVYAPDPTPIHDAFPPQFLFQRPATTPTDVAPVMSTPSFGPDVQPTDPNDEDADYDLDPDFINDSAKDPLPFARCYSPAPPSPLTSLPDTDDEDSDSEEPQYDDSEYEELESLSGRRKRGRACELVKITIYRTDVLQTRSRRGDFKNSFERYVFHDDPQHVRCMKPGCPKEFDCVNAAIDHMYFAHPTNEEEKKKKKKAHPRNKKKAQTRKKKKSVPTRCVFFDCDKLAENTGNMRRHLISRKHQKTPRFRCGDCRRLFQRPDPVRRHQDRYKGRCKGRFAEDRPVCQKARKA
ncbi:uncharacterized protein BT62DRAFT_1077541 [Guyanagaster necrorhizus]|uniref:C2H2-type domain-containing protein n=1 Tax=Guyanagaster necrorhizus TaxID=856835 RepID=A0A9P8ARD9_9AGAR|nr:uncharacterized protein BT62DRAFT_1077541 [Guyanagaster necrorhizus MCA 3950]KAG7444786.1 hypothetical protein BT62DRAFT_1077541 [Guyanagaster necrorhizus MCA 3950]